MIIFIVMQEDGHYYGSFSPIKAFDTYAQAKRFEKELKAEKSGLTTIGEIELLKEKE